MGGVPDLMRAALAEAKGEPLKLVQVATPAAKPGEVLVRVAASAVNPLDTKILAGAAEHARQPLPAILGIDVAGVVARCGEGVTEFREGDAGSAWPAASAAYRVRSRNIWPPTRA